MRLNETVININHLEGEGVSSETGHIPCHKTMLLLAGQEHTDPLWTGLWNG